MNERSSRSHSLFIITVQQKAPDGSIKHGKLNLVDLAGNFYILFPLLRIDSFQKCFVCRVVLILVFIFIMKAVKKCRKQDPQVKLSKKQKKSINH
jgi:hypothetical protein